MPSTNFFDRQNIALLSSIQTIASEVLLETETIKRHLHSVEHWFGERATVTASNWAGSGLNPFSCVTGASAWGIGANDAAPIFGVDDTPITVSMTGFDMHRLLVVSMTEDTPYRLQFAWTVGTLTSALIEGNTTEIMATANTTKWPGGLPVELQMPVLSAGMQVWARAFNTTNDAEIRFFVGCHEYVEYI